MRTQILTALVAMAPLLAHASSVIPRLDLDTRKAITPEQCSKEQYARYAVEVHYENCPEEAEFFFSVGESIRPDCISKTSKNKKSVTLEVPESTIINLGMRAPMHGKGKGNQYTFGRQLELTTATIHETGPYAPSHPKPERLNTHTARAGTCDNVVYATNCKLPLYSYHFNRKDLPYHKHGQSGGGVPPLSNEGFGQLEEWRCLKSNNGFEGSAVPRHSQSHVSEQTSEVAFKKYIQKPNSIPLMEVHFCAPQEFPEKERHWCNNPLRKGHGH